MQRSTGDYYHYTYDLVGDKLTDELYVGGLSFEMTYAYKDNNVIDTSRTH